MELTLDLTKRYTYANYLTWIDDVRRELIEGFIKLMPSPLSAHARVSRNITWHFQSVTRRHNSKCEVFYAPVDVRFPKDGETADDKIDTVVQPDIFIVCDPSKIDRRGCCGAPDLIVEILSPSTRKKDLVDKFLIYQAFGVREYWIADPKVKSVTTYIMQPDGAYDDGNVYITGEKVPVYIFDGYLIEMDDIFNF